jgi:hypothetical protein
MFADQYDREPRRPPSLRCKIGCALRDALTKAGGERLSVNQPRRHHMP